MTRDWTNVALALASLRVKMLEHADKRRREENLLRIQGLDLAARVICSAFRLRSRRFNARQFMRIVRGAA